MRLELLATFGAELTRGEVKRDIGAAVVRADRGQMILELGPADGPPHLRLTLSSAEATRLSSTLRAIAETGGEKILLVDP